VNRCATIPISPRVAAHSIMAVQGNASIRFRDCIRSVTD
jgi:hypothetical protein